MNLRRFRSNAEIIHQHLSLIADDIKDSEAQAYADLLQGLELVIAALNVLHKPENPKLKKVKFAFTPSIEMLQQEHDKDLKRKLRTKTRRAPKVKRAPVSKPEYGTFGCWDYPNAQFKVTPTEADIPELCRQKLLRDPSNGLFSSHEKTREWFVAKGWVK